MALPDIDEALNKFRTIGVSSIELKATENVDVPQFMRAMEIVAEKGFDVSFHAAGRILYPDNYRWQILNIIEISEKVIDRYKIAPLWIIHPLFGIRQSRNQIYQNTIAYLTELIQNQKNYPIKLALENLRNRPTNERTHAGDSYS